MQTLHHVQGFAVERFPRLAAGACCSQAPETAMEPCWRLGAELLPPLRMSATSDQKHRLKHIRGCQLQLSMCGIDGIDVSQHESMSSPAETVNGNDVETLETLEPLSSSKAE